MPSEPDALTSEEVTKLIQDQVILQQGYLRFVQDQAKEDRASFDRIFKRTVYFISIVTLVVLAGATFFGWNTLNQIRDQARNAGTAELDNVRKEVRTRIEREFQTDQIKKLIREVAADRTKQELQGIIRSETAAQVSTALHQQAPTLQKTVEEETKRAVRNLEPAINSIVKSETERKIDESVKPIARQLTAYGAIVDLGTLATLAKANDRTAFDKLVAIASDSKEPEDRKTIAGKTVSAIVFEKANVTQFARAYIGQKPTTETMKQLMTTGESVFDRITALDNYPIDDVSILPILVKIVNTDSDLQVVSTAMRSFNRRTGQSFVLPNYKGLTEWWEKNRAKFTPK